MLVAEPVSSLLEPFKTKMVLEEAYDPRVVARKENVGGVRRRYRDNHWKNKRYGRERFISADSIQASKKNERLSLVVIVLETTSILMEMLLT